MSTHDLNLLRDELRSRTTQTEALQFPELEVDCPEATSDVDLTVNNIDYIDAARNAAKQRWELRLNRQDTNHSSQWPNNFTHISEEQIKVANCNYEEYRIMLNEGAARVNDFLGIDKDSISKAEELEFEIDTLMELMRLTNNAKTICSADWPTESHMGEKKHRCTTAITVPDKITSLFDALKTLVLYKNEKYGNAALEPLGIFSKLNAKASILIRLDDKLRRVQNSDEIRTNDISDLIGYLVLLLVQTGATERDITKQMD